MNKYQHLVEQLAGEYDEIALGGPRVILTDEHLAHFEQRIGYPLPADYKELLRDYGNYTFYGVFFPIKAPSSPVDQSELNMLFGLQCGFEGELLHHYESDLANKVIWPGLLPIGTEGNINQVCLQLAGEDRGRVYYWDHDEAQVPYDGSNLYLVADTFDEFMHLLYLDSSVL